jgi:hypothetical protein
MTTTTVLQARPASAGTRSSDGLRGALLPLVVDIAVPLGSYYLLRAAGCGLVPALALSSIAPAARTVFGLVKNRTVNGLAALIVTVNVVSIAISFWSGDPRIMLAKDGAVSSTIAIAILVSAFAGRPLMTAGLRPFIIKADAAKAAAFDRLLVSSARFRRLERTFSLIWGAALLAECATRVVCAFTLPVGTMVWLGTVIMLTAIFGAMGIGGFCSIPMENMVKLEAGE